jgi:glyoxylase-like metal-dependent hydrolase (beta-lactamase superfamily II)
MFKLDGGAMFGVVPKTIWQKTNPADDNNMCTWAMRCLLIEDGNKLTLIDTGIGNKQSEKFFSHYYLHGNDTLDSSLQKLGFQRDDITDVFLTHLHFDHCGGAIELDGSKEKFVPAFKNATFWSNQRHWQWATQPNRHIPLHTCSRFKVLCYFAREFKKKFYFCALRNNLHRSCILCSFCFHRSYFFI